MTTLTYDLRGRKKTMSDPDMGYWTYDYDALGQLKRQTDAKGQVTTMSYDVLGRLWTRSEPDLVSTFTFDACLKGVGKPCAVSSDNGYSRSYTYDTLGNLTQRVDVVQANLTETFAYDRLNRLLQSSGAGLTTRNYNYDPTGNLTYKSDVGSYNYTAALCPAASGGGPHALCSITGTVMGYTNPSFSYDANGNLVSGLGRSLTYTSFNLPATISAPNNLMPGTNTTYTYLYNAEHERVKHLITRSDGTYTTVYLHPAGKGALLYEKEIKPTVTEHKHYLTAGSLLIGVYLTRSDATTETRYFHHDHLGSLTLITNASGAQVERLAYEAYGKRRYPVGADDPSNTLQGITTDRGFTGHEHLDEIALIHMNGRIYDPLLARFMTPDPYVQLAGNLQSYNRYSYGFNNPLSGVDPSGYGWLSDFFSDPIGTVFHTVEKVLQSNVGRTLVAIVAAAYIGPEVSSLYATSAANAAAAAATTAATEQAAIWSAAYASASATGAVLGEAASGFAATYIASSGDFQAALKGGVSGALFGGINGYYGNTWGLQRVAANSFAGGVSATLQGGDFQDGFYFNTVTASARYFYYDTVKYDTTWEPGGEAQDKTQFSMPIKGAINIGTAGPIDPNSWWGEGGIVSRFLNPVPGLNAAAGIHDVFQVRLDERGGSFARNVLNIPGMLPAGVITYSALINSTPGASAALTVYRAR